MRTQTHTPASGQGDLGCRVKKEHWHYNVPRTREEEVKGQKGGEKKKEMKNWHRRKVGKSGQRRRKKMGWQQELREGRQQEAKEGGEMRGRGGGREWGICFWDGQVSEMLQWNHTAEAVRTQLLRDTRLSALSFSLFIPPSFSNHHLHPPLWLTFLSPHIRPAPPLRSFSRPFPPFLSLHQLVSEQISESILRGGGGEVGWPSLYFILFLFYLNAPFCLAFLLSILFFLFLFQFSKLHA